MIRLIKFSSKFGVLQLKGGEIRLHYVKKNSEMLQEKWMQKMKEQI